MTALLNTGLQFIPSARAAAIFAALPLMTMVLAAALGRERMTLPKTTGVVLTIAGVGLALGEKTLAPGAGAVCSVLSRPYLRRYPTLPVSAFAMAGSTGRGGLPAPKAGSIMT